MEGAESSDFLGRTGLLCIGHQPNKDFTIT